jgi:ZIP family zinc transporter
MTEILLAVIAGAGFAVAGLLGLVGVGISAGVRLASVAMAAGILLSITFSDLLPDAFERAGRRDTAVGFMVGFLVLFSMEALTRAHVHHHDHDDEHLHHHDLSAHHTPRPFVLGLALHNLTDGLAIGTTTALSKSAATAVAVGVLVHQLPVGISFAAVLTALRMSRRAILRASIACGALIPVGAAMLLALPHLSQPVLGTLVAGAGGALCYVACGHLLPEAQSERHALVAPVFAITVVATTAWFTIVSAG